MGSEVDLEDDEGESAQDEESFSEIYEFVRVSVLLVLALLDEQTQTPSRKYGSELLRPANGISLGEYQARRRQLMNAMEPGSIALIPGASMQRRNRDIDYAFRQDSDLLYLCGFEEPDALLVLVPGRSQGEVILFCRERDPRAEQWDGGICGPERAVGGFAVDDAFPITDVDDILLDFGGSATDLNNGRIPCL